MTKEKQIFQIDASALKTSHCLLKLYRTVVQGYRGKGRSNDIEFGSAFHTFAYTFTKTQSVTEAMSASQSYWRAVEDSKQMVIKDKKGYLNIGHLTQVNAIWHMSEGMRMFLPETLIQPIMSPVDGLPLAEIKFRVPFYSDDEIEICLAGTIDFLGRHRQTKQLIIRDYKTTSMWNVEEYLESYALSPQLMFYILALKEMAVRFPESVIGQALNEQPSIGAQIQGIFIKPPSSKDSTNVINSRIFSFSDARMEEFTRMLKKFIHILANYIKGGVIPDREGMLNDTCEMKFGKCAFFHTCKLDTEEARAPMLAQYFGQKPYDPLSFGQATK